MENPYGPLLDLRERQGDPDSITLILPRKSAEQVLEIFNYAAAVALHFQDVKRAVVARSLAALIELKLNARSGP